VSPLAKHRSIKRAAEFVARWEGFNPHAYLDTIANPPIWTVGYGHTGGVKSYDAITKKQALGLLQRDLRSAASAVDKCVTRKLSVNQRAALISFTFNCGPGALAQSTLLDRVNAHASASDIRAAFLMWTKAGGQTVQGLVNRRTAEADLYLKH
jgi:lysozyme